MPRAVIVSLLAVAAAAATALVAAATVAEQRPVLFCISPDPAMVRPRTYCVLNPFRERAPERAAEALLAQLRDGNVHVLSRMNVSHDPAIAANEIRYPIRTWRVGRREDAGQFVKLMYWVTRGNGYSRDGHEEEVRITVDTSRRSPEVVAFGAIY